VGGDARIDPRCAWPQGRCARLPPDLLPEKSLSPSHLGYHQAAAGFPTIWEAEERAMAKALAFPDVHQALALLVDRPSVANAAKLVQGRIKEIDGDHCELLVPASEVLEGQHLARGDFAQTQADRFCIG